jgi:hypothetical protein
MEINELIKTIEQQLAELKELAAQGAAKEKDDRPVTERVKTFEDALRELGDEHPLVRQWWDFETMTDGGEATCDNADLVAFYKLRIITAALNEGWVPEFKDGEWRYWPYYELYTEEEWEELSDNDKEGGLLVGGNASYGSGCGFACLYANSGPASAVAAYFGSRLCYKSPELALYSGRQFFENWADYFLIRRG